MGQVFYLGLFLTDLIVCFLLSVGWTTAPVISSYQIQVSYDMELNLDGFRSYRADLYLGSSSALFVYKLNHDPGETKLYASDSLESNYHFNLLDTMQYSILSDHQEKRILHLEQIPGADNLCIVQEPLQAITWYFTGNSKVIQGFKCLEAYGQFAGRQYNVWFTDSIPTFFGPWKLHGLPGLILEAYDESREVNFYANLIRSGSKEDITPYNPMSMGNYAIMDRNEYVKNFQGYIEMIRRRMMTKFARGYQVKVRSSPIKSIEIYDQ